MTNLKDKYRNHRGKLTLIKKLYAFVKEVYPDFYSHERNENNIYYLISDIMKEIYKWLKRKHLIKD